nr:ABC transporter permease [Pontibacter diazotrophicus]
MQEYRQLERNSPAATGVAFFATRNNTTLKHLNSSISDITLNGITFGYKDVLDLPIAQGRYFVHQEAAGARNVIIIGHSVAEALFVNQNPIGKQVKIRGLNFIVAGVLKKQGKAILEMAHIDEHAYIPYGAFRKMFQVGPRGVSATILIKGREEDAGLLELESEAQGMLRKVRGLRPKDKDNFALNRTEMVVKVVAGFFDALNKGGWIIGAFTLLVGGFGIANIMFVSVKERTDIIGIQKSLGAKNYFILFQFLFESIFLSVIGGGIGILLVFLLTLIPQDEMEIVFSLHNLMIGFGVSTVIGMLSGVIPAVLASNLDPVVAIRSK